MCWGGVGGQVLFSAEILFSLPLQAEAEKLSDGTDMSYMFGSVRIFYHIRLKFFELIIYNLVDIGFQWNFPSFDANTPPGAR